TRCRSSSRAASDASAARCATWETPNGVETARIPAARRGRATAYPTRRPARPYALENVRSSTTFGRCAYTARPSGASGSRTNSRYASSSTTSTSDGTASRNVSSSSRWTTGPVGLLGEHTMTTRVRSVTAAAMPGRSSRPWSAPVSSGTCTDVAPATATAIGYASNDRHGYTTSSPSCTTVWSTCASTATEPLPTTTSSAPTPRWSASASVSSVAYMSG